MFNSLFNKAKELFRSLTISKQPMINLAQPVTKSKQIIAPIEKTSSAQLRANLFPQTASQPRIALMDTLYNSLSNSKKVVLSKLNNFKNQTRDELNRETLRMKRYGPQVSYGALAAQRPLGQQIIDKYRPQLEAFEFSAPNAPMVKIRPGKVITALSDLMSPSQQAQLASKKLYSGKNLSPQEKRMLANEGMMLAMGFTEPLAKRSSILNKPAIKLPGQKTDALAKTMFEPREALRNLGYPEAQIKRLNARQQWAVAEKRLNYQTFRDDKFLRELTLDEAKRPLFKTPTGAGVVDNAFKSQPKQANIFDVYTPQEKPAVVRWFNETFKPLKNLKAADQSTFVKWRDEIVSSRAKANTLASKFMDIPEKDSFKVVQYMQNPTPKKAAQLGLNADKYANKIQELRTLYNDIRLQGIKQGLDIGYLDNYVNNVWKESPEQIEKAIARGAGTKPGFVKHRVIPDYETGLKIGLTPKYTHPAGLIAHYQNALDRAVANKKLVNDLSANRLIVDSADAPFSYKPIDAPYVPELKGKSAPKDLVNVLNNIFSPQTTTPLSIGANISKFMQDVTLSGGIRTLNAFSIGHMVKEFTAGRFVSPVRSFFTSFSEGASRKYLQQNADILQKMAREGIELRTDLDYTRIADNLTSNKTLKQQLGEAWDKNINAPTFRRFLPMLQLDMFKSVYQNGLKNNLSDKKALELASDTVKVFYGIADNFTRSRKVDDALTTVFFAPKFRESMINFWVNNLKGMTTKNPAYKYNQRFLAGTVITYLLYNELNKKFTGHSLSDNKAGKEFYLEFPRGGGKSWYIPILPSIGTLPRRVLEMAGYAKEGDIAGVTERFSSFLSQPVQLATQLGTNRTFYGGPIYSKEDTAIEKLAKLIGYSAEQSSHPIIGEPIAYLQGRKTGPESVLGLLEMPVYPSRSSSEAHLSGSQFAKYKTIFEEQGEDSASKYSSLEKELDPIQEQVSMAEDTQSARVDTLISALKTMGAQERIQYIRSGYANGQITKEDLEELKDRAEPQESDGSLKNQSVEVRAQYVVSKLKSMDAQQRYVFLKDLDDQGVLTSSVLKRLQQLTN